MGREEDGEGEGGVVREALGLARRRPATRDIDLRAAPARAASRPRPAARAPLILPLDRRHHRRATPVLSHKYLLHFALHTTRNPMKKFHLCSRITTNVPANQITPHLRLGKNYFVNFIILFDRLTRPH